MITKTYTEALNAVADDIGERAWHRYMGGAMSAWQNSGIAEAARVLAVVYGGKAEVIDGQLDTLANAKFDELVREQQEKFA